MANGAPCRKCGYQEAEHKDLGIIYGEGELTDEEIWKKHAKLFKCLFGRNRGYEPKN